MTCHLTRSLTRRNILAHVVGVGMPYGNHVEAKIRQVLKAVQTMDAGHVLFVDGRDCLIIGDEAEIIEKFETFNAPFVVSMERACWPIFDTKWRDAFPKATAGNRWPNAGNWMGTRAGVLHVLESSLQLVKALSEEDPQDPLRAILQANRQDDQAILQYLYLQGTIVGDHLNKLFTNFGPASHRITGQRVRVSATGEHPPVLHFAGTACDRCRDQWAAVLGIVPD